MRKFLAALAVALAAAVGGQAHAKLFVYTGVLTDNGFGGSSLFRSVPFKKTGLVTVRLELLSPYSSPDYLTLYRIDVDQIDFVGGGGSTQEWVADIAFANLAPGVYEASTPVMQRSRGGYVCLPQYVDCGYFSRFTGDLFFSGGFRTSAPTPYRLTVNAPIPEPATWAMMIAGFGAAGAVVRSRRRHSAMAGRSA